MFRDMPWRQIQENLIKYTNRQIIKLDNLSKQKADKINDELNNDYENRKATKEKVNRMIPQYDTIKTGYLNNIDGNVKDFVEEFLSNHLAVQEIDEYIKKFKIARDRLFDQQYVLEYREKCMALFLNDKVSEAFDDYKVELLEYLIMVLNGIKPEQHPFNIIITGNPGLGKSHLAGEIVKLLQSTHLLPIGKFINLKKPDVIGQYIGQTAPKAYRRLVGGIGSIIFIDEAYSFAGEKVQGKGYDPFGLEFITAMVDFMEEFRGLIGIIAAGYDKEMKEQFLDANTGLYRRFPIKLRMKELHPMMIITRLYEKVQTAELFRTNYIENFVRLAYHIEQNSQSGMVDLEHGQYESINQIKLVVFDRRTGQYEGVEEDQYAHILKTYFTFFFSNNWTDLQILFDYIQYNHGLHYTPEEQIQNIITQFMKFKIKSDDVIEIFSRFHEENNLIIHLKIKNLNLGTLAREDLLDNQEMGTMQDKIDAMKQKVFGSIRDSRNNSAKNAKRIEEIDARLGTQKKGINSDMPPPLSLQRMNTMGPPPLSLGRTNSASHYAPPPPPLLSFGRTNSASHAPPPPPLLRRTNSASDYHLPPPTIPLERKNSAASAQAAQAAPATQTPKKKLRRKSKSASLHPIKEEE